MYLYAQYSGKLGLICSFLYLLLLYRYRRAYYGTMPDSRNYGFILFFMALYSVFGFGQYDTYHYAWAYQTMMEENRPVGVEDYYFWLSQILPQSYLLWRFVIWGTAALLFIMTAKKLELNSEVLGLMIPVFFLTQFAPTRDSLGFSLMMFSAVLFVQSLEKKKILTIALGILGVWASFYLHKSMFIFISFMVLAFLLPINKKTFIISLILFPFLYFITSALSGKLLALEIFNDQQEAFMNRYFDQESDSLNSIGLITKIFEKSSLVLFLLLVVKKVLYDNVPTSKAQYFTFKYAYLMVYVSFLFLGQDTSIWISSRALHAGMFAMVLCASHCFDLRYTEKRTNLEKVSFILMLIPAFWDQLSFILKTWN